MGVVRDTAYVMKLQLMKEEDRENLANDIKVKYAIDDSDWKHLNALISLKTANEITSQIQEHNRKNRR